MQTTLAVADVITQDTLVPLSAVGAVVAVLVFVIPPLWKILRRMDKFDREIAALKNQQIETWTAKDQKIFELKTQLAFHEAGLKVNVPRTEDITSLNRKTSTAA